MYDTSPSQSLSPNVLNASHSYILEGQCRFSQSCSCNCEDLTHANNINQLAINNQALPAFGEVSASSIFATRRGLSIICNKQGRYIVSQTHNFSPKFFTDALNAAFPGLNLEDGKYDASKPVLTNDKALSSILYSLYVLDFHLS